MIVLVPYRWLKRYVDCDVPASELAERLTMAGVAVEQIHEQEQKLTGVVTGKVLKIEPHPQADKLSLCQVEVDAGRRLQVVCGAPNVAVDQVVPLALPGTVLPGGLEIKAAKIRGVVSEGMICSESELGISDDHSGIMVLPTGTPVGVSLGDLLGHEDVVFEFEIMPNRPDLLGVIGIAREVASIMGTRMRFPKVRVAESSTDGSVEEYARVEVVDPDLCPRYSARVLLDLEIGPSPLWMQSLLVQAGMRPINNVVDVTNFVMLEWGQPLHAFDLDALAGGRVVIRRAHPDEQLVTLDEERRDLTEDDLVIADAQRPVCVAGIMGGANTEVGDGTTRVLLESANFNPVSIRRTSRRMGLRTEASHRFEKGVDATMTVPALDRAASLLVEFAGARVPMGVLDSWAERPKRRYISLRTERVNHILGTDLTADQVQESLQRLEFNVQQPVEGKMVVEVPSFRGDVEREIDLIEEVARVYGYDRIPARASHIAPTLGGQTREQRLTDQLKDLLASTGLSEVITYSFIDPQWYDWLQLPAGSPERRYLRLRNPLTREQSVLRTMLLPGLLDVVARNERRGSENVAICEIGATFLPEDGTLDSQPSEKLTLGLALRGRRPGESWDRKQLEVDFYVTKGYVESVLCALGVGASFEPVEVPYLHPGRAAAVIVAGRCVGVVGEIHPVVQARFELGARTYVAELSLADLLGMAPTEVRYEPLSRYPAVERDLALLVPREVPAGEVSRLIQEKGSPLVKEVRLFDVYEGEQVPAGHRSLAYSITYQDVQRTLQDEEVDELQQNIVTALEKRGVRLRA